MDMPRTPPVSLQVHLAEVGTFDTCLRSGRQRVNVGRADWTAGDRSGVVHGFPGPPLKAPPLPPGRLRPR
jgi:hypothetical protein